MKIIICDIDGTLFDHTHRLHLATGKDKDFDEYNSKLHLDSPKRAVHEILYRMAPHHPIILITGRSDKWREETGQQLLRYNVPFDELHMRPEGDHRKDIKFKRDIFETHIRNKDDVLFVLEDRDCVVEMWRNLGLTCLQVERFEVAEHYKGE